MKINSISDFRKAMRHGPYAWPDGYPCYFVMEDGGAFHFDTAKAERRRILEALRDKVGDGWAPIALEINYEDDELYCDHTGKKIEAAYDNPEPKGNDNG